MRKTAKFLCERKQRHWRHGGREVLCFQSELPDGESGAALHLACLSQRLCDYAERELVPLAAAALEEAVLAGRGYAFTPFTVRLFAQIRPLRGALCITLTLVEKRGEEMCKQQVLDTYWSRDGELQLKRAPFSLFASLRQ